MNENWQISIPRVDTLNTSIPLIKLQKVYLKSDKKAHRIFQNAA